MRHIDDPLAFAEHLSELIRAAGLKVTTNRLRCLQAVLLSEGPVSKGDLMAHCGDDIERSTLYRTIKTLERAGLIRHHATGNEDRWCGHGPDDDERCVFFVCRQCGATTQVATSLQPVELLAAAVAAPIGFVPETPSVEVVGVCASCHADGAGHAMGGDL